MIKLNARFVFVFLLLLACSGHATGQDRYSPHPLSVQDSLQLAKYIDSINTVPLFSRRHQLYYDSALAIQPWKAAWWQQKAMPLFKTKKYEVGLPFLDSAVKYDTRRYIDYRAFMKCIFQKDYRSAIPDFITAKNIIGDGSVMDHTYDFYLGLCYLQLYQFDSAEYYLSATVNDQKTKLGDKWVHPLDLFYLGIVYYEKENYPAAIEYFDKSLKLYTNFSDAKFYKANCLGREHRTEEAKALLSEAGEDFRQGYTMNEDNVPYESYPYQVNKFFFK